MTATSRPSEHAMRLAALWGDQHAGSEAEVATRVDGRSALAVSSGSEPGGPASAGPTDDAALVLTTSHVQLLAVAGGERRPEAARAALLAVVRDGVRLLVRTQAGAKLAGEGASGSHGRWSGMCPWRRASGAVEEAHGAEGTSVAAALAGLLDAARAAVERTAAQPHAAGPHGGAALSVALVTGESVGAVTLGDTSVIRLHGHTAQTLTTRTSTRDVQAVRPQPVHADLSAGDRIVLATNGLLDHLGERWPRLVMAAVGSGSDPAGATSRLLQAAATGGAPRDVAVALTSVAGESPNGSAPGPGDDHVLEIVIPAA